MKINLSGLVLLTGVPGAGKTLRMMEYMEQAIAAGRPCYVANVDGLNVPAAIPFDNPHEWQDLPPNAVLFVDEAQRFFRARRGMVDPPGYITAMETIRHDGVCIVMTTQQPTYLDKHVRGLIGHHEHLIEVIAGQVSNVYTYRGCKEDPLMASNMADAVFEVWQHPKRLHGKYKSAEVHTKKTIVPLKIKILAVAVVGFLAIAAWAKLGPDDAPAPKREAAGAPAPAPPPSGGRNGADPPLSPLEFAAQMRPRLASLPVSAPIFDGRDAEAIPEVYCMSSGPGIDAQGQHGEGGQTCLTEQGTQYRMSAAEAKYMARWGASYNPFRTPPQNQQQQKQPGDEVPSSGGVPFFSAIDAVPIPPPFDRSAETATPGGEG